MPSDIEATNASANDYIIKKAAGEDKFTWIEDKDWHTKGQVTFTLYTDADAETGQAFKFEIAGAESKLYGGSDTGDDLKIFANSTDVYPYLSLNGNGNITLDTFTNILLKKSNSQIAKISITDDDSIFEGGASSTEDLIVKANSTDAYPYLSLFGNNYMELRSANEIRFYEQSDERFKFYEHSVDFNANRAIYINDDETYVGHSTGDSITTGINNSFFGRYAGRSDTTGSYNTFIGRSTGYSNITGGYNIFIGHAVGYSNTDGVSNVSIGYQAQLNNVSNITIVGYEAGKNNTQSNIVAVGYQALQNNTGQENVAVGYQALLANLGGYKNVALGSETLIANTTGQSNTAIGRSALHTNTVNHESTAVGYAALYTSTGEHNTGVGRGALTLTAAGQHNTALGWKAGQSNVTGNLDVFLGYAAGYNELGSNKLYINNSDSAYPLIYGEFDNDIIKFGDNSALFFFKFSHDANDAIVETEAANRSIYLKPHGTGLVKFGTYAAKGAEAFAGFITMKDNGGTNRKVMICA